MPEQPHDPIPPAGWRRRAILGAAAGLCTQALRAQTAPLPQRSRARLLIPASPGLGMDQIGRRLTAAMSSRAGGFHFLPDNTPGGGGLVAARRVLSGPADGSMLLLGYSGLVTPRAHPARAPAQSFDFGAAFAPLAFLARTPFLLACGAHSPPRHLADVARLAAESGVLEYGVSPVDGAPHVAGKLLFRRLGLPSQAVGYTQASQMLLDVAHGRLPFVIAGPATLQPMLADGRLRAIASLTVDRLAFAPGIPALGEQGLAECAHEGWVGVFHRRDVPAGPLQQDAALLKAMHTSASPALDFSDMGYRNAFVAGPAAEDFLSQEIDRLRALHQQLLHA